MAQKDSDLQKIKELIEIMKKNGLVEVEVKHGDDKIPLKRSQPQQEDTKRLTAEKIETAEKKSKLISEASANSLVKEKEEDLVEIKSPIVGTFYAQPSPDSDPFVEVDSHVSSQTVVCIVEAMKVMNEIKAETNGTITEILVTNGQAVEYGQVLFKVKPD